MLPLNKYHLCKNNYSHYSINTINTMNVNNSIANGINDVLDKSDVEVENEVIHTIRPFR